MKPEQAKEMRRIGFYTDLSGATRRIEILDETLGDTEETREGIARILAQFERNGWWEKLSEADKESYLADADQILNHLHSKGKFVCRYGESVSGLFLIDKKEVTIEER